MGKINPQPHGDLLNGLNILARAVRATYGPRGRNVLIEEEDQPGHAVATRDGVTVARSIFLENRWENLGAQIGLAAAKTTVRECGDGTSATILMAHEITRRCLRAAAAGAHPTDLIRGLARAEADILDQLQQVPRIVVTDDVLRAVVRVSSHEDGALTEAVLSAFRQAGKHGLVSARLGDTGEPYHVVVDDGFAWPANAEISTPAWAAHPCLVALVATPLEAAEGLVAVLEAANRIIQSGGANGLLILGDVSGDARATLQRNRAHIPVARADVPRLGSAPSARLDTIQDISLMTGAEAFGVATWVPTSLRDVDRVAQALGVAESVEARQGQIRLVPRAGVSTTPAFKKTVEGLRSTAARADREGLALSATHARERLARLLGSTCAVVCGGASSADMRERLARAEDAIQAGRSAIQHGVLPGCGISLVQAAARCRWGDAHDDAYTGYLAGMAGVEAPNRVLAASMDVPPSVSVRAALDHRLPDGRSAHDAQVFDPALAVVAATRNSFSVARMILSTAVAVHPSVSRDG